MILGMHRSGTSFLTGSLQQAGLELGKHNSWNPYNLKGNRENTDIVDLHEAVLASRGHSWDSPPAGKLVWSDAHVSRARSIIRGYDGMPRWGFKDPRTLLVIDGWKSLVPTIDFVGIFRHPDAVARSLAARGGMSREKALLLWENYNRRLLELHARHPFPILCFDHPEAILLEKLNNVASALGLDSSPATRGERAFFSAGLKHHEASDGTLPPNLMSILNELKAIAR